MKLTPEIKAEIDSKDYRQLLARWRHAPIGDPMFQGETGEYWGRKMGEMRRAPGGEEIHVAASKSVGWD